MSVTGWLIQALAGRRSALCRATVLGGESLMVFGSGGEQGGLAVGVDGVGAVVVDVGGGVQSDAAASGQQVVHRVGVIHAADAGAGPVVAPFAFRAVTR